MWASGALRPCVGTFEKSWTGPAWPAEAVGQELATTEVKCGPVQNWIGGVRNLLAGSVQSPIGAGLRRQELLRGRRDTPAKSSAAAPATQSTAFGREIVKKWGVVEKGLRD